ncbi:MAG: hypothetical protein QOJ16_186 [Acidobacteriota bacterium]|jgi:hypothetical protein|nr:hypothetical protein [Acidobacteriota bacterium]
MKLRPWLAAWSLLPGLLACAPPTQVAPKSRVAGSVAVTAPAVPARVDFAKQIQPILAAKCQPCHFPGGKVYGPMPFDRAETVLRLREKLFTRIKDEAPRRTIREFLAQNPAAGAGATPAAAGR